MMPPPLPLPPATPHRPTHPPPDRSLGYMALAAVVFVLTLLLVYGLRKVSEVKAAAVRNETANRVKEVLVAQQTAWNAGDLTQFMAGYWNDDRLTFASGDTVTHGWQATLDRYRQRYQAEGKEMGTLTFSELEVSILGPDKQEPKEAVVLGRWELVKRDEKPSGRFTLLMRYMPDGWRIVHDHTSAAEPPKKE